MDKGYFIVLSALATVCVSQRSTYAGIRPIGYPRIEMINQSSDMIRSENNIIQNSVGLTTKERLPLEARGNRNLINRLQKLPQDKQPFWLLNWRALDANRMRPQTYSLRRNIYLDDIKQQGHEKFKQ